MRVLVTGGCGFVGSAVVRLAVERGDHVLNLDRRKKSVAIPSLGPVAQREGYARLEADVTDRAMIKAILREFSPDAVIHLAACGDDDPNALVDAEIGGAFAVIEAAGLCVNDFLANDGLTKGNEIIAGIPAEGGPLPFWLGALAIKALPFLDPALAARLPFAAVLLLVFTLVWYSSFHLARTEAAQPVAFAFGGEANC